MVATQSNTRQSPSSFALAFPAEICEELGHRVRQRRLQLNLSIAELAGRVGISALTLQKFETSGRSTLETFVRILSALNASSDLEPILAPPVGSIDELRKQSGASGRKRARSKRAP